jgi:hypothetical protein
MLSAVATQPTIEDARASAANVKSAALPSGERERDSLEKLRVFVSIVPLRQSSFFEVPILRTPTGARSLPSRNERSSLSSRSHP